MEKTIQQDFILIYAVLSIVAPLAPSVISSTKKAASRVFSDIALNTYAPCRFASKADRRPAAPPHDGSFLFISTSFNCIAVRPNTCRHERR
ncbi:MAG TPA: hypothetical protein VFX02_03145 [Gammaproteobacteria bacterium]|nr:hypothetical protein [Gammaproteobacteria bacterium]